MIDAYESGDLEPKVDSEQTVEQFGVTAVTNIKVKGSNERSSKKLKLNSSASNQRYEILMKLNGWKICNGMIIPPRLSEGIQAITNMKFNFENCVQFFTVLVACGYQYGI